MSPIRAAVMVAPNVPVELREIPVPPLHQGAAMLRTLYSEVCGTDVHLHAGKLAGVPYPIVPGHVSVGHIEAIRGHITDVEGRRFGEGDLVTFLDVHETCGACHACLVTKQTTRCPHRKVYGITYSAMDGPLGGWSDQIWMKPGVHMIRIPPEVNPIRFIAGGCGLVTALHAVERAGVRLGSRVAVLGVGPVGQSVIAAAALSGAHPIIAIGDPAARLEVARKMGATHTIGLDMPRVDRIDEVLSLTRGKGVDIVIEAAGAPAAVGDALDIVRDGGRVVVAGQYTDHGPFSLNPHTQLNRKHAEVLGCWGCDYSHFHRAVEILAEQGSKLPWEAGISRRYPLSGANEALASVAAREVVKAIIVPNSV
jgi:D-arabinose 1-dehydrogenase-like Zn-dependent alcohol dehydrogenase